MDAIPGLGPSSVLCFCTTMETKALGQISRLWTVSESVRALRREDKPTVRSVRTPVVFVITSFNSPSNCL